MNRTAINVCLSIAAIVWSGSDNRCAALSAADAPMFGTLNGPDYLVSIDRNTGAGTRIGHLGIGSLDAMTALEYDAQHGILYGASAPPFVGNAGTLFTINLLTGAATVVNPGGLNFIPTGLASDPIADVLYGAGPVPPTAVRNNLYKVDRVAGTSTLLGAVSGISFGIQDLSFDPATNTLYALDEILPSGARVVKINTTSLVATPVSGNINSARTGWNGLTFDPVTNAIFVSDDREMYRVNPVTGAVTSVGLTLAPGQEVYGALTVAVPFVIPEPMAITTAILAMGCLMGSGRLHRLRQRRLKE